MRLKELEIQGFKSFPDKTKIEIGEGITGVVGPNGSGKSNISDSIRWVLGETSSKQLRGSGKMEDVIFGGTQSRGAMGYASVALTIDNSDHGLDMDADEVTQAPDSSGSKRPAPPLRHARRPARWVLRCEGHTGPLTDTPVSVWLGPSRSREGSGILLTALVQRQREWHRPRRCPPAECGWRH